MTASDGETTGDVGAAERFRGGLPQRLSACAPAKVLEKSLATGRLAHAILLHGDDLRDSEAVALALASALIDCDAKDAARHPDYIALRPGGKARQIRIGERGDSGENTMRSFLRQISQTPNRGKRKLAVVYDADRMNVATANAFLKTLEEPPADTTLLLLSTRPYDLLDTIRSRCFHFRISSSSDEARDGRWQKWLASYSGWLDQVAARPRKPEEVAQAVIGLYALSQNFSDTLGALSDENWDREKETLPENLPDEQIAAMEAGSRKGLRQLMFAEVEAETLAFVRKAVDPARMPGLFLVHESMEKAARLCDVFNLKEDAALEAFLLNSMRAWAAR